MKQKYIKKVKKGSKKAQVDGIRAEMLKLGEVIVDIFLSVSGGMTDGQSAC